MSPKHAFIESLHTETTGGGCMIDFILLKNGQLLAIDNDLAGLYDSYDDFWDGRDGTWEHVTYLNLREAEE